MAKFLAVNVDDRGFVSLVVQLFSFDRAGPWALGCFLACFVGGRSAGDGSWSGDGR